MQCVLSVEPRQLYTIVAQITQPQKMSGSQAILGKKHLYSIHSKVWGQKKFPGISDQTFSSLLFELLWPVSPTLHLLFWLHVQLAFPRLPFKFTRRTLEFLQLIAERSQQLSVQHIISNPSYVFSSWPSFSLHNLCNKRLPDPMPLTFDHLRQSWLSIVLSHWGTLFVSCLYWVL